MHCIATPSSRHWVGLRIPRLKAGGSDLLPLNCFRLRDQRFTVQGRPRRPVRRPSLCYGGTSAVTTPASPATVIDRSHGVPVPRPATLRPAIPAVCGLVAVEAPRAYLAGVGRVYPFHCDARTLCLVGDEARELVERPSSDQAVGFAGFPPPAGCSRRP